MNKYFNTEGCCNPAHFTQEEVVAHLQLRGLQTLRSSYSQIECGTYNVRVSELIALAELFRVDYNAFFLI
ncbi:MAG: helix-turn-helix domain-containing protein [Lachnospiraceae bacterium]|nr:helix-turn-helix domain-containing protein [Lachnospiraceae bacterium]